MPIEAGRSPEKPYLVDFGRQGDVEDWRVVNDGVMGGLSRSQIHATPDGTAVFIGHLSLENNGGFASVRRLLDDVDLSDYDGVIIRVRGDGRTYQIRFRTDRRFDGATYRATFVTEPGQWKLVRISFTEFEPTFRGRLLPELGPLDTAHLQQVAFMVADKKQGLFRLEIEWVKPFVSEEP
jgi:monofunctional biosynthetic peptidoglycan transglycosylase